MALTPFQLRPAIGKVRICGPLQNMNGRLMVWYYGGLKKNLRDMTVPLVAVFFTRLDKNDQPIGELFWKDIALPYLGLLRIGSIWEKGICKADAVLETKRLDVDFTKERWTHVSPFTCMKYGLPNPICAQDYPLYFPQDRNWLLDFPLPDGKNLLIPCLEFLIRCYGRSEEVSRVLATYSWSEVQRRFYAEFDQPILPGAWPVKLKKRMRDGDVVFLAHAKYDEYANSAARDVYGQIEASYKERDGASYSFVKVRPWFQGTAKIKVGGLWINDCRTFLGLRILGGSDPQGEIIQRHRENSSKAQNPVDEEKEVKAFEGAPECVLKKLPDIVDLTDVDAPDHGAPTIEVAEDDYEILGEQRKIIDVRREQAASSSGKPRVSDEPGQFSAGEVQGSNKMVGIASIHARPVLESHGVLHDIWEAMQYLSRIKPDKISSVEWFTFEQGFQVSNTPQLIGLELFDDKAEGISTETRRWPIFNTHTKTPRGILVAKLMANRKPIYVVEIQRRPQKRKDEDGSIKEAEESFKGLVFTLDDHSQFKEWLRRLLSSIRYVRGVVDRLARDCPGRAATFKHTHTNADSIPCEAAVSNALCKMGVEL